MKESIIYYSVRFFGAFIRVLPIGIALFVGKVVGLLAYYFDMKRRRLAHSNIKKAFSGTKSPKEIKVITKKMFLEYGQNLIELLRMSSMDSVKFSKYVKIEGMENIKESRSLGKGVILLAMHFGSWEMASLFCAMFDYPYKVIVKPQTKHSKLDELLNSYRECGGSIVLSRGMGTRDFVKSLKSNEVIGMVVDQGGRDGTLIPFFGRNASMSVGAIRMGLKLGVPICFSIIIREKGPYHKMIIHKPFDLVETKDVDADVYTNLKNVCRLMEKYIDQNPSSYMWFHKIWKYSDEANISILSDGKTGHLRQSQIVAGKIKQALEERSISGKVRIVDVAFKNRFLSKAFSLLSATVHPFFFHGRLSILRFFLKEESYTDISGIKTDFVVSCGSSVSGVNNLVSRDYDAKSIAILNPGLLSKKRFDLVFLPQHDIKDKKRYRDNITVTKAAPNLINPQYIKEQADLLLQRFSYLKDKVRPKIGVFIGGDSKDMYLNEQRVKVLVRQIKEAANELKAEILLTTSRRTPENVESLLQRELKKDPICPLLILASKDNVPEAVGGILGLSDVVVVSGDSISMVSEAASSGKRTVVFFPEFRKRMFKKKNKHEMFVDKLNAEGYILASDIKNVGDSIYNMAKDKIQNRMLDDSERILNAVRLVI